MIEFTNAIRSLALHLALLKGDGTALALLQPQDFTCIAQTAFAEARGEGEKGMALVVQSIINRHVIQGKSGCKIAAGAYDGFRYIRGRDPRVIDRSNWRQAQLVTLNVLMGEIDLGSCSTATHFLNPAAVRRMPNWASRENRVCRLGNHVGYRVANI